MALPAAVRLYRPKQWYKNLVVLVALVFSNNLLNRELWLPALLTLVAFCALSGAVYAWNDFADRARDRDHPRKRTRPVASGALRPGTALALGALAAAAGLALLLPTNAPTLLLGALFLLLQATYSVVFKHQVVWDVIVIGVGFVLRALAGTTAIEVGPPTEWLILCTFLFALFLALAKRRHELLLLDGQAGPQRIRSTLGEYNVALVESMTHITAALLLASYFLYTALGPTPWMMLTAPFAVFGVFRYLYLVSRRDLGDEPELLFRDGPTVANAATWLVVVFLVLRELPQDLLAWLQTL